ncbi:uncharacterized protein BCR38DRAFT_339001 [Pseudomassariella vexata]|uniref:Uncharacterized protein n=1 Tax=Pseudomassariella vexata TaxID=1141098 RepID=A0A1Y2E3V9_9PEZI|nr:uncharacterized protein BCR38DRAFT_339001 [Pseudomassariella vexata]ORY66034.1 hypothetical protein BCR38DRAFT_339001 [Pseudomassariella vexata]
MPRFPVNFRRKSTVIDDNGPVEPSFRVLDRTSVGSNKSFDSGPRMKASGGVHKTTLSEIAIEDNLFVDGKTNRGSGSSNTTKTASDNSSRHSNVSTAPSSTDFTVSDEWRGTARKSTYDPTHPPAPKSSTSGFLKHAGKTFSFSSTKKHSLPTIPAGTEETAPSIDPQTPGGRRTRAQTASTTSTATPPKVEDRDFMLDLGGDLSNMLSSFNKRASLAAAKNESGRPALASRNLTGNRISHPSPLHLDHMAPVEPPPHSWNSQGSHDGLLGSGRIYASPSNQNVPPPVPRHTMSPPTGRRMSDEADEDSRLLKDSLAAATYLSGGAASSGGYRRNEDSISSLPDTYAKLSRFDAKTDEDNMFDTSYNRPAKGMQRAASRHNQKPGNKVMTPEEFERYRQDKVRQRHQDSAEKDDSDDEDEVNYEDDEDEMARKQELAKQRRKQEAHMTVYRQQMMKVTGEQSGMGPSRPTMSMSMSMSTPNLTLNGKQASGSNSPPSEASDDDDEVPLAILQAHGFPNKTRPPTRLTNMSSNPNLRASAAGSVTGENQGAAPRGNLPAFARKLPQDPFLGAGLVNGPPRESFALPGGSPAALPNRSAPPGGLVGVIASEERQRAARRGSPAVDNANNGGVGQQMQLPMNGGFDPIAGIPPQMMYPMGMPQMPQMPMLTPGDQAQIQMTQQMQQFMQMQMQFMQMMASQQGQGQMQPQMMQQPMQQQQMQTQGLVRPQGHLPGQSLGSVHDMPRNFLGDPMGLGVSNGMSLELPRGDAQMRTMSMVQPSSASWIQPPSGLAPSICIQGNGYAPSIAPSERSNVGLPGRYRPVSSMADPASRTVTMSGALPNISKLHIETKTASPANDDEDDDEEGWEAMKAKREKKKSIWRSKKNFGSDIGALIN